VRADPRFAELRANIWRQLHTARPGLAQPRAQTAARPAAGEVAP
jgi:hypothetical protein